MGYRSEVAAVVGKNLSADLEALRKKYSGDALSNLEDFLNTAQKSADGRLVKYHVDWFKWYTDVCDTAYNGLSEVERLIKQYCDLHDSGEDVPEGYEAAFLRLGESDDDREACGDEDLATFEMWFGDAFDELWKVVYNGKDYYFHTEAQADNYIKFREGGVKTKEKFSC